MTLNPTPIRGAVDRRRFGPGTVMAYLWCAILCALFATSASAEADKKSDETSWVELDGQWSPGGIIIGKTTQPVEVFLSDRQLRVGDKGYFVFGLDRDHQGDVELKLVHKKHGDEKTLRFAVSEREYQIQRIEGVQQKHVTPPESVLQRIRDEAVKVRGVRERDDARIDFSQDFIWPLSGRITGVYGSQRVYNGVPKSPHYGLDIAGPVGAEVLAPAAGIVTLAEPDLYYSGGTLILDHGHGLSSTFIHLSELNAEVGQRVEKGDVIAKVGATGRATGPHLDWRMNWFGVRVDPQLLMHDKPMPQ